MTPFVDRDTLPSVQPRIQSTGQTETAIVYTTLREESSKFLAVQGQCRRRWIAKSGSQSEPVGRKLKTGCTTVPGDQTMRVDWTEY